MSSSTKVLLMVSVFGLIFAALYKFYEILVLAPEEEEQKRLQKLEEKRLKKQQKKLN